MHHASNPAVLGAIAGLVVGFAQYVIALRVMARLIAWEGVGTVSAQEAAAARLGRLKLTLLAKSFLILPAIGYLAGLLVGH
jgi:hypothetical protein